MPLLRRIVWSLILGVIVLFGGVPYALYWLGLDNVNGRPSPTRAVSSLSDDNALLQSDLGRQTPIRVHYLTPWHYLAVPFTDDPEVIDFDGGAHASWLVATHYNRGHLKADDDLWRYLSGVALTIWITQHWTSDEVVRGAAAVARASPHSPSAN